MLVKVVGQHTNDYMDHPKMILIKYGFCDNCGHEVSRSQYGCDEECPGCGAVLDWSDECEDDVE